MMTVFEVYPFPPNFAKQCAAKFSTFVSFISKNQVEHFLS